MVLSNAMEVLSAKVWAPVETGTVSRAAVNAVDRAAVNAPPESASVGLTPEPEDRKLKVTAMPESRRRLATASTLTMTTVAGSTPSVAATADANAVCAAALKLETV